MKKTSLSKIFSTSVYHDTRADPSLISSIMKKKRRMLGRTNFVKGLVVIALLVLLGIALFWVYTLFTTTDFVNDAPGIITTGEDSSINSLNFSEEVTSQEESNVSFDVQGDWEEEALQEVKELLTPLVAE